MRYLIFVLGIFVLFVGILLLVLNLTKVNGGIPTIIPSPTIKSNLHQESKTDNTGKAVRKTDTDAGFPLIVPENLILTVFARNLDGPRVIKRDPEGTIIVSLTKAGKVVALPDKNNDGSADTVIPILTGLNHPHGLALNCDQDCLLYVAETDGVYSYRYNPGTYEATNKNLLTSLPSGGEHFTRSLYLDENNKRMLLISVGSTCNVCIESDTQRASILKLSLDTLQTSIYAQGLRNAVFMAKNPYTNEIWDTEMGRDYLGDTLPPDEINILKEGGHYGWPYCYGNQVQDTQFERKNIQNSFCASTIPSHINIPAHSAPLGLAFFPAAGWPKEYAGDMLVAYHGSWNRTEPTGYKIVRYILDVRGNVQGEEDFMTDWLNDKKEIKGRPVDILIETDSIFISDDYAGIIYKLTSTS